MPTRSPLAERVGVQVPRVRHTPRVRGNDWEDVADLAKAYGLVLYPWQENVLQAAMGVRSDGQWATPSVGVAVPRQNGKGAIIEARELAGLLLFGEKTIVHSAHEQKTARVGFDRILAYFENYDDLRKKVMGKPQSSLGRELIKLRNGAVLAFPARSKGAIRGFSIDCLILDEGQILGDPAWEAIRPTISARPNVQTWLLGTPPTPLDDGTVFTRMRQRGLEGKDHRLCWCEWSADPHADPADREAWAQANPSLGLLISEETVADELGDMSVDGFRRERLGIFDADETKQVIAGGDWARLTIPDAEVPRGAPDRYALTMSPERVAAIAVAIRGEVAAFVDLAELERVTDTRRIVDWLAARCGRRTPVMIDSRDPAAALIGDLRARGVQVNATTQSDAARACTALVQAVEERRLWHVDQPAIRTALRVAKKKPLAGASGKAGMWEWDHEDPTSEVAALRALTLAHFGLSFIKKRSGEGRSNGSRKAVVLS